MCRALSSVCSRNFALFYRSRDQNYETWATTFRAVLPSFDPRLCANVMYLYIYYMLVYAHTYIYRRNVEDFRLRDKRLYSRATRNTVSIYW